MDVTLKEILEYHLFSLGKYYLTVYQLVSSAIIVIVGMGVVKLFRKLIYKSDKIDIGKKFAFSQILKYIIIIITAMLAFKTIGVDVSPLLVGGGVILVGIGLGLQNLVLDFISGIMILLDRSIKVDDIVEIEGTVSKVQQINIRTSTLLTRDNKTMIIPNSYLTKNKIINMTYDDDVANFGVNVGVNYNSDIELVQKLMLEAANEHPDVYKAKPASVSLVNFGPSAIEFALFFNTENIFKATGIQSQLRMAILRKFRENKIDMPFPTSTVYMPDLRKNEPQS